MTDIATRLYARATDIQVAGDRLHLLLDSVVLEPREGMLGTHPSQT